MHDDSPEMVTEGSAMAKAPAGTTEDPAMVEEVGSEDELEDITPVMEEIWTPPYHVPESSWSVPGPLDHVQTPHYTFCLLCEKWCSAGHLMSAGHSTAIPKWIQSGKPVLKISPRFAEDEQVEMLIQSRHPTWSRRTILAAKQAILQAYYRAQEGTFRGEIPKRESQEGLGGGAGASAPTGGAAGGIGRRSMGELARLSGPAASCYATHAPSDSAQAATAPKGKGRALASSAATNAGACGIASTAGACGSAPVGATFANTAAVAASYDSGPGVLVETNTGTEGRCSVQYPVGAKLPSERRVGPPIGGGERGMADSAGPGASGAAKGGEQVVANATAGTTALHGSTAASPSSSTTTPWSHVPGFGNLLPPPQVPKEPPRDP